MKPDLNDVLIVAGRLLIGGGLYLVLPALVVVFAGVLLIAGAALRMR